MDHFIAWTSAYITGMAYRCQCHADQKQLALDAIAFYEAMRQASNEAYASKTKSIENLKDERENDSLGQQDAPA